MFLRTKTGIIEVPKRKLIKSLFCKHENRITGEHCSEHGMVRISGIDRYEVCLDCGKVTGEDHLDFDMKFHF